jgi:cysteine desulfurase family protein
MAVAASGMIDEVRLNMTRLIKASDKNRVIFTLNCTDSLNIGIKGLLKTGDHVITSTIEHNSVVRPLRKLETQGIRVTWISPRSPTGFVSPSDIQEAITDNTRLVVMSHASNVSGVIQPIDEYGRITRRHDIIFMVDAAQTAGRYPINVEAQGIDMLACSGHKGLLGPPGVGVLYIGERVDLESLREGGTGSQSELEEQPSELPNKLESGTPNTVGIAGLGAGLKLIAQEGIEKILAYEKSLGDRLMDGLSKISGVHLYRTDDTRYQAPIVSFTLDRSTPGEAGTILDQAFDIKVRTGLHCAPAAHKTMGTFPLGTIRLSPGYYNTVEEMDIAVRSIEKIAGMSNLAAHAGSGKIKGDGV